MYSKIDQSFYKMLKKVREKKLDSYNIWVLNQRLAIELLISSVLNIVILIQKNKTCHFINYLQIEIFVDINNWDIIICPGEYYWIKKDIGNII